MALTARARIMPAPSLPLISSRVVVPLDFTKATTRITSGPCLKGSAGTAVCLSPNPKCPRDSVVILTTSDAEVDILKSYLLQANCYLTKPVQLDEFERLVKSVNDFWLTKVKLPR
jgi:CheY-like chemotaxis protein